MSKAGPVFRVGQRVRWHDRTFRIVGFDNLGGELLAVWLRVDNGVHYSTATTRELELIDE